MQSEPVAKYIHQPKACVLLRLNTGESELRAWLGRYSEQKASTELYNADQ